MKLETEELKKYEFTGEENTYNGNTVRRIRAIRDFGNIKAGDLGGWLEKEENLSLTEAIAGSRIMLQSGEMRVYSMMLWFPEMLPYTDVP